MGGKQKERERERERDRQREIGGRRRRRRAAHATVSGAAQQEKIPPRFGGRPSATASRLSIKSLWKASRLPLNSRYHTKPGMPSCFMNSKKASSPMVQMKLPISAGGPC